MMKNIFRMMGLCAFIMLAAVSCKKNENGDTKTFRATLTPPTSDAKTYLGSDNYLYWNSGDAIKVFADDYTSAIFTTNDSDVKVADFSGSIAQSENYFAIYPASNVGEIDENGKVIITIPSTQQYVENGFATDTYLMAARTEGDTPSFDFHGIFGLLCLRLKGEATITSIELEDAFFDLCGDLSMSINFGKGKGIDLFEGSDSRSGGKTITLNFPPEGLTLDNIISTKVYFVLRPLACSQGFTLRVHCDDGIVYTKTVPVNYHNAIKPDYILRMPEINLDEFEEGF